MKLPSPRRWLGLLGLFLLAFNAAASRAVGSNPWAPFNTPWFDKVSSTEGLPPSIITALAQDKQGLLWVGTMVGLARYDGYRTQLFDTRGSAGRSLPDAYVRCLLALPDGGLLIGTNAGGLVRFDPATNLFHTYPSGVGGTSAHKIYALSDDHAGGIWIATDRGLDHLDLRSNTIRQLKTGADTAPRNFSVMQDRAGNLWLGNNNGLFVRRAHSQVFVRTDDAQGSIAAVLDNQIWAIAEDSAGQLWVGSGQAGAVYRDNHSHWHAIPGFSGNSNGAQHSTVRDFIEESPGTMWIATDGSGVFTYRPGDTRMQQIQHDPAIDSSLPGDVVRDLLRDRSGNLWVATDLGLARTHPDARTAFAILPSPLEPNTLRDTNVRGIYVDSRQRIWLGLGSGRIDMIDLAQGRMHHLQLGGSQVHRDTQSFVEAADGSIWVGTQGLARIDPNTLAVRSSILPALENVPVLSLNRDGSVLLIGTYDGLFRYNIVSHALDHIQHEPNDPTSLASDIVRQIAQVGNQWWYGTTHGISIAASAQDRHGFQNLLHDPKDPASLPQNYISAISTDASGTLWISAFGGLVEASRHSPDAPWRFDDIGMAKGLDSDTVSSALSDNHGRIWVGTSSGISVIDKKSLAVRNLGPRNGLHIRSYLYAGSAARAPGGELLFGGLGGLTVIQPDWQPPPAEQAPLTITNAVINDAAVAFGKLPRNGDTITLDRHHHNLRVDFSLLDFQAPEETSYSYRMEGIDDGWVGVPRGALPSANYTNLPHGSYQLRLRAVTHGMQPHTTESSLIVTIKPRWYETLSSRLAAIALLLVLLFVLVHLRTVYLRHQAARLQRQINDHTRDLRAANQRLDELASTDGLTGVYNRRRFLELVHAQRTRANGHPVCIALFDLDRFKQINDSYGHLAGDSVIRGAIEVINRHCRQGDLVGRYGGEEFVLCLPDTSELQALEIAERICAATGETRITHGSHAIQVTVSVGIAALRPDDSIEQWLSRADKALYEAKRAGRNRCCVAS